MSGRIDQITAITERVNSLLEEWEDSTSAMPEDVFRKLSGEFQTVAALAMDVTTDFICERPPWITEEEALEAQGMVQGRFLSVLSHFVNGLVGAINMRTIAEEEWKREQN